MGDHKPPVAPSIVVHALRPQIAVYASSDVDDLARANGLSNLAQLLKPWEASVERVTLRTSAFVSHNVPVLPLLIDDSRDLVHTELDALFLDNLMISVDKRIPEWLQGMESLDIGEGGDHDLWKEGTIEELTPWYAYYREALVNRRPRTEYETFGHPVACIIAVSTSNPEPLNAFAELYDRTSSEKLFANKPWVDPNILRYYVLVHDLSTGPSEEWSGLLEDIRRAYGLHCGFLALNSESANLPDSAYASKAQRPPPKSEQFADYWKSLPTSPTIPTTRTFSSAGDIHTPGLTAASEKLEKQDQVAELRSIEPGKNLGEEDVRRIKAFLREFTVQSLVPWMEKTVSSTNEQLAANRRGIAGRLFSAGRRYFGSSRPASPAQGGPGQQVPTYDPQRGIYPHQTQEAQTRRLADFAFMICDYRLAASMYEIARKDFLNDKAWRHYASATRMAGLTALLLSMSPGAQAIDADMYLEQAAATSPSENTQLDDLRAVALYYELYRLTGQWRKASAGLARIASGIEELPGALMLEQAAMALLKLQTPARRRFSLLMAIAAHRYQTTGSKALSRQCGIQAMSLYSRTESKEWQSSRRHMEHLLGRQAYNIGHPEQAIKHFISILGDHSTSKYNEDEATADDQSFLDDFGLAWEALGDKADEIAQNMYLKLPMPLFKVDATYLAVAGESMNTTGQNKEALNRLEQDFLHYGYPYTTPDGEIRKRPASLLQDQSITKVAVGAPVEVIVLAQNPLNAEITLQDIEVLVTSKDGDDAMVAKATESARLAPSQSTRIALSVTAAQEGTYTVTEVSYRFSRSLLCRESLNKKGARLHNTRAEMLTPTYGNDTSLTLVVSPPGPSLSIDTSRLPSQLLAGEVVQSTLRFANTGTRALRNLRMLCSHPHFLQISEADSEKADDRSDTIVRNGLSRPIPVFVAKEIPPGQDIEIAVMLRGDAAGAHSVWLLCAFEDPADTNKITSSQTSWNVEVTPFLSVTPSIRHEDSQETPILELSVSNNDIEEPLQVTGLCTISASWQLTRQNDDDAPTSIPYGQTVRYAATASLDPAATLPSDLWATTLAQIKLLLLGQDEQDSEGAELGLVTSQLTQGTPALKSMMRQILATRSVSRLQELQKQFQMLNVTSIRRIFPLFTPNPVDVVLAWELPSQGRSGYYHLLDLSFAPSPNIVDQMLDEARDNMSSLKEEGHRERMQLIDALAKSELGGEQCPLSVRQISPPSILADHGSMASTTLELTNRGNYPATATLELLGPHSRSLGRYCPPVAWAGRMIHRATLEASGVQSFTARYQAQHGTRDAGSWILAIQQGPHHWTIVGKERLVTTTAQETQND